MIVQYRVQTRADLARERRVRFLLGGLAVVALTLVPPNPVRDAVWHHHRHGATAPASEIGVSTDFRPPAPVTTRDIDGDGYLEVIPATE